MPKSNFRDQNTIFIGQIGRLAGPFVGSVCHPTRILKASTGCSLNIVFFLKMLFF